MARWLTLSVATLFVNAAAAAEEPGELVRWKTSDGGNGHWYRAVLVPEGIGWIEAHLRATARGCGWYLATITSQDEDEFVFGLIADDDRFFTPDGENGPWLGAFQKNALAEPDGNWRWTTDEPFQYSNWAGGEPNNTTGPGVPGIPEGSPEDFIIYVRELSSGNFAWNDAPGSLGFMGYLLEFDREHRMAPGEPPARFSCRVRDDDSDSDSTP
jgi:hypothetical protein